MEKEEQCCCADTELQGFAPHLRTDQGWAAADDRHRGHEKLPSVRSLATQLSINPNTIQRAYNELEAEGYIYSVAGKGSFVSGTADADAARRASLTGDLRKLMGELRYLGVTAEEAMTLIKEVYEQ